VHGVFLPWRAEVVRHEAPDEPRELARGRNDRGVCAFLGRQPPVRPVEAHLRHPRVGDDLRGMPSSRIRSVPRTAGACRQAQADPTTTRRMWRLPVLVIEP